MKGRAIIGFNHGVLGLAENPALGPDLFRQSTSGYALGVLTPKGPRAGFLAKPSTPWLKPITLPEETVFKHVAHGNVRKPKLKFSISWLLYLK